jgi:hypothetical protein
MSKHAGGRPLLFKTPEEMQTKIDTYFKKCEEHKQKIWKDGILTEIAKPLIPTIAGLAYELGTDRQTIYNYEKRDEFFDTIKKARNKILSMMEDGMMNSEGNVTGKIFLAKNYGYSDRTEVSHDVTGSLNKILQGAFFDDSTE